jgi:hypothetical protein
MAVSQDLSKEFAPRAMERHGLMLLRSADAVQFVERCADRGITVFGIDAFLVTDDHVQPLMEHSIDFSVSHPPVDNDTIYQKAADFLKARDHLELWFEIVAAPE